MGWPDPPPPPRLYLHLPRRPPPPPLVRLGASPTTRYTLLYEKDSFTRVCTCDPPKTPPRHPLDFHLVTSHPKSLPIPPAPCLSQLDTWFTTLLPLPYPEHTSTAPGRPNRTTLEVARRGEPSRVVSSLTRKHGVGALRRSRSNTTSLCKYAKDDPETIRGTHRKEKV